MWELIQEKREMGVYGGREGIREEKQDVRVIGGRLLVGPGKKYWTFHMKIKHLQTALC